jgi:hypothetical protein
MGTVTRLSSSMAHDLREGLAMGEAEYRRRLGLAALSPDLPAGTSRDDVRRLAPALIDGEPVVRLLDALLLNAIAKPGRSDGSGDPQSQGSGPEPVAAAPEAGA